ncbi:MULTISPECIES: hypothetical protein [Cycloclasticus]|nr:MULTISPECIES: hypothetical protein [Cycloclasticus]MDF1690238.1 hypothetical protein [Cycloclasticus sp.]MDF1830319.1 hypothetical protein [Cycloclasticus pugetii]SHJ65468.1 hypothetical protein SAMN05519226_2477 [Cycloclasticus pugetii]
MSLNKSKVIALILLLLVFVGQSMASAVMPYQKEMNNANNQSHHMTMDGEDDSTHLMHDMDNADLASEPNSSGCAESSCYCAMGGCSSAMLPTTVHDTAILLGSFQKNSQPPSLAISQIPTSLYRPPISR